MNKFIRGTVAAVLATAPVTAFADSPGGNPACENSGGNAAFCDNDDSANGAGVANPDYASIKHDQTATSEVRVDSYLNAELTNSSEGFSLVTMEMNDSGEVGDELFSRTFRVSSNSDHEVQVWYDAISVGGACVPVFDSEGSGSVAGEADVIGGSIVLKVGDTEIFSATAGASLDGASDSTVAGVTVSCDDSSETGVDAAVVTITTEVASTFSREYTLDVTAFGENGSIIFADGDAINAGDAPAGQYDNDILIAAGTLNTYSYDDGNDRYADAAFSNEGAEYYGDDD
jgi:hypothetical protein